MSTPKYKVGQVLHRVFYAEADPDEGLKASLEVDEFVVRSIRKGWVSAVLKLKHVTWVKVSKKHFDWGWAKNIPQWCRTKWKPDQTYH